MAGVNDNLIPPKKGEVRNPNGRPKGIPNRKDILNYLLFESDVNEMGVITNKPSWWDKVKPRTLFETMTLAQAIKATSGDTQAYSALNKALGDTLDLTTDGESINPLGGLTVEELRKLANK